MLFDPAPGPLSIVTPLLRKGTTMLHTTSLPRLVVLPFVVLVLSLGLTFGTGTAARAYATPPSPVTFGTVVKSAPVRMLTMTSPAGLAINTAVFGGMLLYETRDSWLPVMKGALGFGTQEQTTKSNVAPAGGCIVSGAGSVPFMPLSGNAIMGIGSETKNVMQWGFSRAAGCSTSSVGVDLKWRDVTCSTPNGVTTPVASQTTVNTTANNSFNGSVTLCPNNSKLLTFTVQVFATNGLPASEARHYWSALTDVPSHSQTAEVQCRKPDGTLVTISDTITGEPERIHVPSCADRVPGSIPWSATVKAGPEGGIKRDVWAASTDQSVFDEYADCFGPTGLVCSIRVFVGGQPCEVGDAGCVDWKRADREGTHTVTCRFGSYTVGLSQCEPLRNAYRQGATTKVLTSIPEGATEPDPYADPLTSPGPGTSPGTGTAVPETGTNPTTPGGTVTPETDPDSVNCWGEGWSWNPVSWVYVPVKCALRWAFVPSVGFMDAELGDLRADLDGTEPAKWLAVWDDFDAGQGMTGCEGLEFKTPAIDGVGVLVDGRIGEACSGKMADYAGMVRLGISLVVVVVGGLGCINGLLAGFGLHIGSNIAQNVNDMKNDKV